MHFRFEKTRKKISRSRLSLSLSLALSSIIIIMDSPCDYEEERARRIAENMKRLAELGVVEVRERSIVVELFFLASMDV